MPNAIVTGAAGGLGRAIAGALADAGFAVYLTDIADEPLKAATSSIAARGGAAHSYTCDIADPDSVDSAIDSIYKAAGSVDVVVNNAGTTHVDELLDLTFETWRRVLAVNADGVFLVGQAVARRMVEQDINPHTGRRGMIINVGSVAGEVGRPPRAAYGASKALVKHLTMTQALALAENLVAACLLVPGEVMDGMLSRIYDETARAAGRNVADVVREAESKLPRGVFQTAEEIGSRVEFLATSAGMEFNGTTLWCDSRVSAF